MTDRVLSLSKRAFRDLNRIEEYISRDSFPSYAIAYRKFIVQKCYAILRAPMQGEPLRPGRPEVRKVGLDRRVSILFEVTTGMVLILSIAYAGRLRETSR